MPGKVKTRLAHTMGDEAAVRVYKTLVTVLLHQLQWVKDTHYRLCFTPEDGEDAIMHWLLPELSHRLEADGTLTPLTEEAPTLDFTPQSAGNLGERLENAFQTAFSEGYKTVSVIGSDCPFLSARWIETALIVGKKHDCVIGPTEDGGYYYLSLKSFSTAPFRNIPWSTDKTYAATIKNIEQAGLTTHVLPPLCDIDHEADWKKALQSPLSGKLRKTFSSILY